MKKRMTRNISIMAVLTLLMGVVLALYISNTSSVPDADNSAAYGDGEYTAAAAGYLSDVTVTVTIAGGRCRQWRSMLPARPRPWAARRHRPWRRCWPRRAAPAGWMLCPAAP